MPTALDHNTLHRTAKYFMDSGQAATHEAAVGLLQSFGLTVRLGAEVNSSPHHQAALLTLVNVARRTLLGGVEVVGPCDGPSISPLAPDRTLAQAVTQLGGRVVSAARPDWPAAAIGTVDHLDGAGPRWQLTWNGWRAGVIPVRDGRRLDERTAIGIAPALAAAVCAAEAFAFHAGDHPLAGRRATGLSLWHPGRDWQMADPSEPQVAYLPSRLWVIGTGNLGQAFAWLLACLPFRTRGQVELVLHDFDRIAPSNDSTSILSFADDVGRHKARCVSRWLEDRGFTTVIEERRFGDHTRRAAGEPNVALCGVDNALARMSLEKAGFDLIVEAGLGAGPNAFRSISLHTFPASRTAEQIWSRHVGQADTNFEGQPAYRTLRQKGMDACGLAQLASRTVGVPFVGVVAGCLVVAELLKRLNGGTPLEVASGSVASLEDFECVPAAQSPYPGAFEAAEQPGGVTDDGNEPRSTEHTLYTGTSGADPVRPELAS
ncbi:ThiF family adenylyltransferase [bacterium]|nr:ThiF family adenylyltransferase [bacterium]